MSIKVGYNKGLYNKMVANQESQGNARALGTALGALGGAYLANQQQQRRQQANSALAQEAGIPPQYAGMYDQGKLLQLIAERRRDEAMRENERYQQGEMMRRETMGNEAAMARLMAGQRGDLERARFGHESDSRLAQITAQRDQELARLRETTGNEAAMARLLAGQRGDLERARFGHQSDIRKAQIEAELKNRTPVTYADQLKMRNMQLQNAQLSDQLSGLPMKDRPIGLGPDSQADALARVLGPAGVTRDQLALLSPGSADEVLKRYMLTKVDPTTGGAVKQPAGLSPQTMEIASRIGLSGVGPGVLANLTPEQQRDLLAKRIGGQMSDADVHRLLSSFGQGTRGEQIGRIFGVPQDPRQQAVTDQVAERLNARGFRIPPRGGAPAPGTTQGIVPPQAGGVNIQSMTPAQKQALRDLLNDDLISAGLDEADQEP